MERSCKGTSEKNAAQKREKRKREVWQCREGGGEELFIPRFGCIPGCLALILLASWILWGSYLQTDWTPGLPVPRLIQTFQTLSTMAPPDVLQLSEKEAECDTRHLSLLGSR